MQLISDSEPITGIHDKMTAIEESPELNLKESINILKSDINSGNKENIQSQENIMNGIEDAVNGSNEDTADEALNADVKQQNQPQEFIELSTEDDTSQEKNILVDKSETNEAAESEVKDELINNKERKNSEIILNETNSVKTLKESSSSNSVSQSIDESIIEDVIKSETGLNERKSIDTENSQDIYNVIERVSLPTERKKKNNFLTEENKISEAVNPQREHINDTVEIPVDNKSSETDSTHKSLVQRSVTEDHLMPCDNIPRNERNTVNISSCSIEPIMDNDVEIEEVKESTIEDKVLQIDPSSNDKENSLEVEKIKDTVVIKDNIREKKSKMTPIDLPKNTQEIKKTIVANKENIVEKISDIPFTDPPSNNEDNAIVKENILETNNEVLLIGPKSSKHIDKELVKDKEDFQDNFDNINKGSPEAPESNDEGKCLDVEEMKDIGVIQENNEDNMHNRSPLDAVSNDEEKSLDNEEINNIEVIQDDTTDNINKGLPVMSDSNEEGKCLDVDKIKDIEVVYDKTVDNIYVVSPMAIESNDEEKFLYEEEMKDIEIASEKIIDNINEVSLMDTDSNDEEKCLAVEEMKGIELAKEQNVTTDNEGLLVESKLIVNEKEKIIKLQTIEKINDPLPIEPPSENDRKKVPSCKLSNTLDILSDDDDDINQSSQLKTNISLATEKQCINIEDDDDIMLIDEDTSSKEKSSEKRDIIKDTHEEVQAETTMSVDAKANEDINNFDNKDKVESETNIKDHDLGHDSVAKSEVLDSQEEGKSEIKSKGIGGDIVEKPLLSENFLKTYKKNIAVMTRDEIEEFCIIKIVESVVDRSNLGEIKTSLKTMAQNIEEYKKKVVMLTKQNRDLQVVLKSIQEEQKKKVDGPITPLKITRSVGMQVLMADRSGLRKKPMATNVNNNIMNRNTKPTNQNQRQKSTSNQQIPVPRLVPANNPAVKTTAVQPAASPLKTTSPIAQNGVRVSPPVQKQAEKRQRAQSVTVDLTDDEPPTKIAPRSSSATPVRLVTSQNLLATQRQPFGSNLNCPRKVYIPISGPQNQTIRPAQTFMLKALTPPAPRQRGATPQMPRIAQNPVRLKLPNRHPAPLPDATKQYQPPNWKSLPPAPDLKLSKVENGIVISWKIDNYDEVTFEEIASYQLYAYQETSSPPSTTLWKKIGDVKALPLPMACTLTQFMAGFKYYFAVRAVDVRSRLGPFSLPGSILLLNKM